MRRAPSRGSTGPSISPIRRRFIEERYRLLPYLYAVAEQNSRTGDPIMRPVFYDYPAMAKAPCDQSMAFTRRRATCSSPRRRNLTAAAALRRLPARRRLVRLLERSPDRRARR